MGVALYQGFCSQSLGFPKKITQKSETNHNWLLEAKCDVIEAASLYINISSLLRDINDSCMNYEKRYTVTYKAYQLQQR